MVFIYQIDQQSECNHNQVGILDNFTDDNESWESETFAFCPFDLEILREKETISDRTKISNMFMINTNRIDNSNLNIKEN